MKDAGILLSVAYILGYVGLWAVLEFPLIFVAEATLGVLVGGTVRKWWIRATSMGLTSVVGVLVILALNPWSRWPEHSELDISGLIGPLSMFVAGALVTGTGVVIGHFIGRD